MNIVDRLKGAVRRAPPAPATQVSGSFKDVFDCDRAVVIVIDDRGRVFQLQGSFEVTGGNYRPIADGRTAVISTLDLFGVQDMTPEEVAAWVQDPSE